MKNFLRKHHATFKKLKLIVLGSGVFFLFKLALVSLLDSSLMVPPWLNFLLVTIVITLVGWTYHSKVSFGVPLSFATFKRYIGQSIVVKLIDYLLFLCLVYLVGLDIELSVVMGSVLIYVLRIIMYFKFTFKDTQTSEIKDS